MLQASAKWNWYACHTNKCLMLDLGDEMEFCTAFKLRLLTDDVLLNPRFNLRDAEFYQQVSTYLTSFELWNGAQICQIAINATAAKFYLKPVLTKSWFFKSYSGSVPSTEAIVLLHSKAATGQFLIVDHNEQASLCLNLEGNFQLDENLSLQQFEVIRVLNDRIYPLDVRNSVKKRA